MTGPIGAVGGSGFSPPAGTSKAKTDTQNGFGAMLQQELERTRTRQVAFSKHALNRAEERGIEVTPALLERLGDSVERVITTLSETEMKDSIFTNIDGAVFL